MRTPWTEIPTGRQSGYEHEIAFPRGKKNTASQTMPRVHRVIALLKRWLMGTHQGAVSHKHLDYYLDEFPARHSIRATVCAVCRTDPGRGTSPPGLVVGR